ncbi:hypothetical protein NX059_005362 [Plenodomus lindquistii]|nr:hypothetical protein NX059_005362 [Plenodomus lindquistii]
MPLGSKLTVIFCFSCRLPNVVCTILRLIYLDAPLTPTTSSYYSARLYAVTQLAIAYTITSCVIPYLRPLIQAHENADGTLRRPSGKASYKLSQSSAVSGHSGRKTSFRKSRAASAPMTDIESKGDAHHHRTAGSATYEDIGRLLQPVNPVVARSRSEEPVSVSAGSSGVKTFDWDLEAEIRPVVPVVPPLVDPMRSSRLSEPWRGRRPVVRSARSGEDSGSFTAADFV